MRSRSASLIVTAKSQSIRFELEMLEQRVLLSADGMAVIASEALSDLTLTDETSCIVIEGEVQGGVMEEVLDDLFDDNHLQGEIIPSEVEENEESDGEVVRLDETLFYGSDIHLEEGDSLVGSGSVEGELINRGKVSPGNSPGIQSFSSFTQEFTGTTIIEIGGLQPGPGSMNVDDGYDQINVTVLADLNGTIEVSIINGFVPQVGDQFQIMTFGSVEGDFANYKGINLGNDLILKPQVSESGILLEVVESVVTRPVLFIPGLGGTLAQDDSESGREEWFLNRGIHPEKLAMEPLGNRYDDFMATLSNVGYVEGVSLFGATWDWRMPVALEDGVVDGHLGNHSGGSITDNVFESGVDYLGYWLSRAVEEWTALTGAAPDSVDVVTHSTGGLVSRAYIQSDAYGDGLPEINELIQVGVPNQGASAIYNLTLDN